MPGRVSGLSKIYEANITGEQVKPQKKTGSFRKNNANIKGYSGSTGATNYQKNAKSKEQHQAVDYDVKSIGGLTGDFKAKLAASLATKPKNKGMVSPKRNQETTANNTTANMQEQVAPRAIIPTRLEIPDGQKIPKAPPPPPPPPPSYKDRINSSLKSNVNYQRSKSWDTFANPQQEKQLKGTKATTPKTKQSQDVMDELSRALAKRKKS